MTQLRWLLMLDSYIPEGQRAPAYRLWLRALDEEPPAPFENVATVDELYSALLARLQQPGPTRSPFHLPSSSDGDE